MFIAVVIGNLVIDLWLLAILHKQGARKRLPWFVYYIIWGLISACAAVGIWLINIKFYVTVYWWLEVPQFVLIVGAVRESFLRIFKSFTSKSGFRWTIWGAIAAVIFYSAWKAVYAPPIESNRLATFIIGSEFAFRWAIVAIWVLTVVWSWLLQELTDTWEDAVITGFGIASIGVVANTVLVSLFGTRYLFFSKYLPSVGYFMAALWWIFVFSKPVQDVSLNDLGMELEDVGKEINRYRSLGERITRKK